MLTNGSVIPTADVEPWVRAAAPYPHYLVQITELPQPDKHRVHVTTEITGPRGKRIDVNGRRPVYYTFRPFGEFMEQPEDDWVK